jgi:hypothetical protein
LFMILQTEGRILEHLSHLCVGPCDARIEKGQLNGMVVPALASDVVGHCW